MGVQGDAEAVSVWRCGGIHVRDDRVCEAL